MTTIYSASTPCSCTIAFDRSDVAVAVLDRARVERADVEPAWGSDMAIAVTTPPWRSQGYFFAVSSRSEAGHDDRVEPGKSTQEGE